MRKIWIYIALAGCILATATGCGDQDRSNKNTADSNRNETQAGNVDGNGNGSSNPAEMAQPPVGETEKDEEPAENKQPEAAADPVEEPEKPQQPSYEMNKNYFIVPKDKAAGNKNVVLLTFDDGPKEERLLTSMLDTLEQHKAKAIFFVNGFRVKENPELLKLIHERGQTIGNHSWDHINLKKETNEKVDQQIGDVNQIVKELTGTDVKFFRPPFGAASDYVKQKALSEGMLFMTWSNGSLDWTNDGKTTEAIVKNVTEQLHPGSNILMHELQWTSDALDTLLTTLEGKGYSFVDPAAIEIPTK